MNKPKLQDDFLTHISSEDTVFITANLSICTMFWIETNIFFMRNDSIFLKSISKLNMNSLDTSEEYFYSLPNQHHPFIPYLRNMRYKEGEDSEHNSHGFIKIRSGQNIISFGNVRPSLTSKIYAVEDYKSIKYKITEHQYLYEPSMSMRYSAPKLFQDTP